MTHRPANIRHRPGNLLKYGRPGWIRYLALEDVTGLQPVDLLHRPDDPRGAFRHTAGGGETLDFLAVEIGPGTQPGIEALACNTPQHDDGGVIDHIRHRTERRRSIVLGPFAQRVAPFSHYPRPALRTAWWGTVRP